MTTASTTFSGVIAGGANMSLKITSNAPGTNGGNVWTGATFGVFAVRDGAKEARDADFDFVHVTTAAR